MPTAQSLRELLEQIGLIDECFVTQSNSAHELVVLTMEFMDCGAMSRQSVLDQVQTSDELIDDIHGIMKSEYELVREFAVSRGTLPVIDALSWFWLPICFLIIKAVDAYKEGKNAVVNDGPGLRLAGTFRGMRLVDINTGRAIFSNEKQSDLRDFAQEVAKSLAQAPIGVPISSAAAEQVAEGQIGSDLTTNMVYQIAKRSAAELRHKVRSKCVENYERNFYEPPRHNPPPNPAGLSSPKWAPHIGAGRSDIVVHVDMVSTHQRSIVSPDWTDDQYPMSSQHTVELRCRA
ncbi:hypothetical protein BKA62DRAFT_737893 [Auriculariales sp. MPI-PUGE-AT-0066]|nr:hypothetical protein BKA62DRAFT_737893 [Auriculariales sp. MPI-PUGE-AT-0066]